MVPAKHSSSPSEVEKENALYLLDRGWGFDSGRNAWVHGLSGAVFGRDSAAGMPTEKLKNVAALLERGFRPSSGGIWVRGKIAVDGRLASSKPHEEFMKYLREKQRRDWILNQEGDEAL